MRIDSHQHFWDLAAVDYFWMPTDHPVLSRNYLPADLWPIMSAISLMGQLSADRDTLG